MKRMVPVLALLTAACWQAPALAQRNVSIHTPDAKQPVKGILKEESPLGIKIVAKKEQMIPADKILDAEYELSSASVSIQKMRPALNKEKDARAAKGDKKAALLAEAVQLFQASAAALDPKTDTAAQRHMEYKAAALTVELADLDRKGATRQAAVARLSAFVKKFPQSWQISAAVKTLAQLQLELKQWDAAEASYNQLAKLPVSEELKKFAQLRALQVGMDAGRAARAEGKTEEATKRFSDAVGKLKTLGEALPKGVQQQRTLLALAEMLTELNKVKEAEQYARQILKDTTDKQIKAAAYNTLGFCYYRNKQWPEARWEFLWVDVIYNQDREEHAKALYYLAEVFTKLGEGERSRECLDQLLTDPQFTGTEYQRRAANEEAERNKKQQ